MPVRNPKPLKPSGPRVCAICGKGGSTVGFRRALALLGIKDKDKAHPACVRELQEARRHIMRNV